MTWEIALGIFTLVAFVISIATISSRLSGILAEIKTTLAALNETLIETKTSNSASHKDIYSKLADHEKRVGEIETKIDIYHGK